MFNVRFNVFFFCRAGDKWQNSIAIQDPQHARLIPLEPSQHSPLICTELAQMSKAGIKEQVRNENKIKDGTVRTTWEKTA